MTSYTANYHASPWTDPVTAKASVNYDIAHCAANLLDMLDRSNKRALTILCWRVFCTAMRLNGFRKRSAAERAPRLGRASYWLAVLRGKFNFTLKFSAVIDELIRVTVLLFLPLLCSLKHRIVRQRRTKNLITLDMSGISVSLILQLLILL